MLRYFKPSVWLLATLTIVGLATPAAAQFIFEPGFENELWRLYPTPLGGPMRGQLQGTTIPPTTWAANSCVAYNNQDPYWPGALIPVALNPACTTAQVNTFTSEFIEPTDFAFAYTGFALDGVTPCVAPFTNCTPQYRVYVLDSPDDYRRVLTFVTGPNGTFIPDPKPDADWNAGGSILNAPGDEADPDGLTIDSAGNVIIGDWRYRGGRNLGRFFVFDRNGKHQRTVLLPQIHVGGIAVSPGGSVGSGATAGSGFLAATANDEDAVYVYDASQLANCPLNCGLWRLDGTPVPGKFYVTPTDAFFDAQGRLIVVNTDASNVVVYQYDPNGTPPVGSSQNVTGRWTQILTLGQGMLTAPYMGSVDQLGRIIVSDTDNQRVVFLKPDYTNNTWQFQFQLDAEGQMNGWPRAAKEDPYGRLLVADFGHHEVKLFELPNLGIYRVKVLDNTAQRSELSAVRVGQVVNVRFSVTVPLQKLAVSYMVPSCASATPLLAELLNPTSGLPDPAALPVAVTEGTRVTPATLPLTLANGQAARYECQFVINGAGNVSFTVDADGNRASNNLSSPANTFAEEQTVTVPALDCINCETDPPTAFAVVNVDPDLGSDAADYNATTDWYRKPVEITITATDTATSGTPSGIRYISYQQIEPVAPPQTIDMGAPAQQHILKVPVTLDGRYKYVFWATDAYGNTSAYQTVDGSGNPAYLASATIDFNIDQTPPRVELDYVNATTGSPANVTGDVRTANGERWFQVPVRVNYTVDDTGTGQSGMPASGGVVASSTEFLQESTATDRRATVTATDVAGNVTQRVSRYINLDLADPTTTATNGGVAVGCVGTHDGPTQDLSGCTFQNSLFVVLSSQDTATGSGVRQLIYEETGGGDCHPQGGTTIVGMPSTQAGDGTCQPPPPCPDDGPCLRRLRYSAQDYAERSENGGTPNIRWFRINRPPTAVLDTATVAEDSQNNSIPVLANDTDPDGLAGLQVLEITNAPDNGTATMMPDGTISYTPNGNYTGSDLFEYRISDGQGGISLAVAVMINVVPVNDAPVANDDTVSVTEDSQNNAIAVLGNDNDAVDSNNSNLSVTAVTDALHGTVTFTAGGVTYTPDPNYFGPDSFTYTISDGGLTDTATVNVTVTSVNDPPDAVDDTATVAEDSNATAIDVRANDSIAPDTGETLSVTAASDPVNGTTTFTATGVTYRPDANFVGTDTFTYTVSDGNLTDVATVTVTVTGSNDNPVANNDTKTVAEDSDATAIDVLANDNDGPDTGETLTVTIASDPPHGTVVVTGTGVTYAPDANYFGPDSFTYTISDGNGGTATATVNITVTNVNDGPTANADSGTTTKETAITFLTSYLVLNDTDPENNTLTVTGVSNPVNGTVQGPTNGQIIFTPALGWVGGASFDYTISDGNGGTSTATVRITVTLPPDNVPPSCANAAASPGLLWPPNHKGAGPTSNVVVGGVTDADGDAITIRFTRILQDEPTQTQGDGNTTQDGNISSDFLTAWVRAERSGTPKTPGDGRVYLIDFTATDTKGASCSATVTVGIPHDQGNGTPPVLSPGRWNSLTGAMCTANNPSACAPLPLP